MYSNKSTHDTGENEQRSF